MRSLAFVILWAFLRATMGSESADWPHLPAQDGIIEVPAQEWPLRPGVRTVRTKITYPVGNLSSVRESTGLMLTLHNWGGVDCVGTADPATLARELNVIAICVNYLQSGPQDSVEGPEPYDFGFLQAIDALRGLYAVRHKLQSQNILFAAQRTYVTGGSGGGNVALMANKFAPRTFAGVIDICGMKKLSDDVAYGLPAGSDLNARYVRDTQHTYRLTPDHQELRFLANRAHLQRSKAYGTSARIVVVHGVNDQTCPFEDAQEFVNAMQRTGLDVIPRFISAADIDGEVYLNSEHSLGDRSRIVVREFRNHLAQHKLAEQANVISDFERREEIDYPTADGRFIVSYQQGYPAVRFEQRGDPPAYQDHTRLTDLVENDDRLVPVRSRQQWLLRREHILRNLQSVMGPLPSPLRRTPIVYERLEDVELASLRREKIRIQSDPDDWVSAYVFSPRSAPKDPLPAVLCLQQTSEVGKDEPAGLRGDRELAYALELAERGYITIAPDYPSFGEHPYDFAPERGYASGSMKAIWDNIRAIDYLETRSDVDRTRIACIGHSLGGHNAVFTAVFDDRLSAVVSSCGFTSLRRDDLPSWTEPRYMPRIETVFNNDIEQLPFDFHELLGTLAPRPVFVFAANQDDDFDVTGVREVVASARHAYHWYDGEHNLQESYAQVPHSFPRAARNQAYGFLDRVLEKVPEKNLGKPSPDRRP